jgi:hypothetical protein
MDIEVVEQPEEFLPVLSDSERERLHQFFRGLGMEQQRQNEAILDYGRVLNDKRAQRKAKGK